MKLQKMDGKTQSSLPFKLPKNYSIGLAKVADLVPYARNARVHSPQQVQQLRASIREFGWTYPILCDAKGDIIAGHGRVLAAQAENFAQVPVIVLDHLSEQQKKALRIADNKHALNSTWDWQLLADEMKELHEGNPDMDFEALGYMEHEANLLLQGDFEPPPVNDDESSRGNAGGKGENKAIHCSPEEHTQIVEMLSQWRDLRDNYDVSDGEALLLLCKEWRASVAH